MIKILHNLALFLVKNANFFAEFFGKNTLKIITSVPGLVSVPEPVVPAGLLRLQRRHPGGHVPEAGPGDERRHSRVSRHGSTGNEAGLSGFTERHLLRAKNEAGFALLKFLGLNAFIFFN
jgi:hypothetical protein